MTKEVNNFEECILNYIRSSNKPVSREEIQDNIAEGLLQQIGIVSILNYFVEEGRLKYFDESDSYTISGGSCLR